MPIYEYHCKNCDVKFEYLKSISESKPTKCPKCDKEAEKLISNLGGLKFNGSGFYINDYKKEK